ncbi:MAG: DUF4357 domain-containing protein [Spirochaetales bacterium]|nr:DUF4357 domain-containing protein [Spirochaetales bacterium]
MADGTANGPIVLSSSLSSIKAVRVQRSEVSRFSPDLNGAGVYFLIIGSGSIYVGQSGLDTVRKRIMNKHTNLIDSSWHTVLAFICNNPSISSNELLYLENAMCEFVHNSNAICLTISPSKSTCNEKFRNEHYKLMANQIMTCNHYIEDMKFYISYFQNSIFGINKTATDSAKSAIFFFENKKRDCHGNAEILVNCGHKKARKTILKKGARISLDVSPHFASSKNIIKARADYQERGIIIDRTLQEDIVFNSQSGAGEFLNGTSFNGNKNWKTADDKQTKLIDLL